MLGGKDCLLCHPSHPRPSCRGECGLRSRKAGEFVGRNGDIPEVKHTLGEQMQPSLQVPFARETHIHPFIIGW